MTKKNKTIKVGDRVRWLYDDGTRSGDIGTVVSVPPTKYGVDWDVGINAAYEARKLALEPAESKVTDRLYKACQALAEEYINNNQAVDFAGNGMPGSIVMEIIDALDEAPLRSNP